jgi:hypothetical protein
VRPKSLRSIRASGEAWDPRFFERDARFWPIAAAARRFADRDDWPRPEEYTPTDSVRFVSAIKPRRQRRYGPIDVDGMYDAQILKGIVPTRPRCWHDFLNALVWATFPKAKRALHEKQAALIRAWIPPHATTLPNARTREHDALAFVDEGGVVLVADRTIAFGHALYEGLVFGTPAMIARAIRLDGDLAPLDADLDLASVDAKLAERLREPLVPEDLPRFAFR